MKPVVRRRYDDAWFAGARALLLRPYAGALSDRQPHAVYNFIRGARLGGGVDPDVQRALGRLPERHAGAVRAHMQMYRACLVATGILPSDALVNVAVQVEWFWSNTVFTSFYRDHLAHVMKVAAMGLDMLLDPEGPLATPPEPLIARVARELSTGRMGSASLRAAARRSGNPERALADPAFWQAAALEALRLAALLHDMAHPAVIVSRMSQVAAPVRPRAPFEPTEEEVCRRTVSTFGHRLLAAPFNRGEIPGPEGLDDSDAEVCAEVFRQSHSLRAGYSIARIADDAGRVWRLCPFDAFVLEWAALAASVHDYNKIYDMRRGRSAAPGVSEPPRAGAGGAARRSAASTSLDPGRRRLLAWLDEPEHVEAIRPSFRRDPVTYLLAFCDQMQDFGRICGVGDQKVTEADQTETMLRYPVRAATLQVEGAGQADATVVFELGDDDGTCFGATANDYERIFRHKHRIAARDIFGADGWLKHEGMFDVVKTQVQRAGAARRVSTPPAPRSLGPTRVFCCYDRADETYYESLEKAVAVLRHQGLIALSSERTVPPGRDVAVEIEAYVREAEIIVLLVSFDFLASDACWAVMARAMERHEAEGLCVVPVHARAADWASAPFCKLQALPRTGGALQGRPDLDVAWADVVAWLREAIEQIRGRMPGPPGSAQPRSGAGALGAGAGAADAP